MNDWEQERPCKENSMANYYVDISQDDIDYGSRNSSVTDCPIARALIREEEQNVRVYTTTVHMNGRVYKLTEEAREFIALFDEESTVLPGVLRVAYNVY